MKKEKKEKLTITLSPEIMKYISDNFNKKSRFIEYCIQKEITEFKKER